MMCASGGMFLSLIRIRRFLMNNLERICESGTDAIIIGGTDGVTLENILDLMARVRRYTVPCVLEISSIETVTPGFDLIFYPNCFK